VRTTLQTILSAISAAVLILLLVVLLPLSGSNCYAVTLAWDESVCEGDCTDGVDGYKIYWGNQSGIYPNSQDVGNVLQTDIAIPSNSYIAVTGYNIQGESGYSSEIFYADSSIIKKIMTFFRRLRG